MALGAVLQFVALGVPRTAEQGSALVPLSGQPITGPGLSQPGLYLRMPDGELDTYPAEGAGTQPIFTPPPTEPAPAFLFPEIKENFQPTAPLESNPPKSLIVEAASSGVEQWRSLVALYMAPENVDGMLNIMRCESGGNPNATGGAGERSLFQIHPLHPDSTYDPEGNIRAAARISAGGYQHGAWDGPTPGRGDAWFNGAPCSWRPG